MSTLQELEGQLNNLELSSEKAEYNIKIQAALERLHENDDYKLVFIEDFLNKESERAVGLLADPALRMQGDVQIQIVKDIITTIGGFRQYVIKTQKIGWMSQEALAENRQTTAEVEADIEAINSVGEAT